jgi:hypothetical protein
MKTLLQSGVALLASAKADERRDLCRSAQPFSSSALLSGIGAKLSGSEKF